MVRVPMLKLMRVFYNFFTYTYVLNTFSIILRYEG